LFFNQGKYVQTFLQIYRNLFHLLPKLLRLANSLEECWLSVCDFIQQVEDEGAFAVGGEQKGKD
jgi:hypothetical protein